MLWVQSVPAWTVTEQSFQSGVDMSRPVEVCMTGLAIVVAISMSVGGLVRLVLNLRREFARQIPAA